MPSYVLAIVGYCASDSTGTFEWGIAGAKAQLLAAGRGTIAGCGTAASQAVERLTYHALLDGIQALLAEDYVGALTIAAARRSSRSCGQATMVKIRISSDCGSRRPI